MPQVIRFLLWLLLLLAHSLRLLVGGGLIAVGILGVILPILPGMPFLIMGMLIIGRRSRLLRRLSVGGKRQLRHWAADSRPPVARLGRWSVATQRDSSKRLRHLVWWLQARGNALRRAMPRIRKPIGH